MSPVCGWCVRPLSALQVPSTPLRPTVSPIPRLCFYLNYSPWYDLGSLYGLPLLNSSLHTTYPIIMTQRTGPIALLPNKTFTTHGYLPPTAAVSFPDITNLLRPPDVRDDRVNGLPWNVYRIPPNTTAYNVSQQGTYIRTSKHPVDIPKKFSQTRLHDTHKHIKKIIPLKKIIKHPPTPPPPLPQTSLMITTSMMWESHAM